MNKKFILDPKNDVVFQKIFGSPENEKILISFLNALLENTEKNRIVKVTYADTKLNDIDLVDDKVGVLDIRVITENGVQINVEIQLINKYNMINRTLFYWSKLYSNQIRKGSDYRELKKTITINILNFNYIENNKYHTTYHLYEDIDKTMLTDLIEIHFVELFKFQEEGLKPDNSLRKWLTFLTKPNEKAMEVVKVVDPEIKKAYEILDSLSADPQTVRLAELRLKKILDDRSFIEGALEEGMRKGMEKGLEKGLEEGLEKGMEKGIEKGKKDTSIEIAKKLLELKTNEEDILKITGITIEELQEIKNKQDY